MSLAIATALGVIAATIAISAAADPRPSSAVAPVVISDRTQAILKGMGPAPALYDLESNYLRWPLPPGEERYGRINGEHLKRHVDELAAIARGYRDQGHQYWGRIMGTSADAETARWLEAQYRRIGLTDVRSQPFDVPTTTMLERWTVRVSLGGKTLELASALPFGPIQSTPTGGSSAKAVYVGLGEAADFQGRDVKGKAVFIFAVPEPSAFISSASLNGAVERADQLHAAAVFVVLGLPGNITGHMLLETREMKMPCFAIGKEDGALVRKLVEASADSAPEINFMVSTQTRSDLKTANVWGVLPGRTDETIIIAAHRDGYYEAAFDNASGVATMLGLAEYYAAIPQDQRRRTLLFVGTPGHHDPNYMGTAWMHENREEVFSKTALLINAEHTAYTDATDFLGDLRKSNAQPAFNWYAGGSRMLQDISIRAFRQFGVPTLAQPDNVPAGEVGKLRQDAPIVQIISAAWPYHSNADTADIIPPAGLEASTRAYAKIIDEVNEHDISELRAPTSGQP